MSCPTSALDRVLVVLKGHRTAVPISSVLRPCLPEGPKENVETFKRGLEAGNSGDVETLREELDPAVEWHSALHALMGGEQTVFRGHQGVRKMIRDLKETFAEIQIEMSEFRDLGDGLVAIGRTRTRGKASGAETVTPLAFVTEILGSTRSSHAGSVHARSPSSVITAGATTMRTTSASIRIAAARPRPIVLTTTSGSETKPRKTLVMITPAARMILPTRAIARTTLWAGPAPPMYSSRMRDCRKTL